MYDYYISATNAVGTGPAALATDSPPTAALPPGSPAPPAPPATQSHYVQLVSTGAAEAQAITDEKQINNVCGDHLIVLDFGQVADEGSGTYSGYGTNDFQGSFASLGDIESYTEMYEQTFYNNTLPFVDLKLVVSTNNDLECQGNDTAGSGCTPAGFGLEVALMLQDVVQVSDTAGWSSQIYVWFGDDIESGNNPNTGGPAFDSYATTFPLVYEFNEQDPENAMLIDFGDDAGDQDWSPIHTYTVA